MTQHFTLRSAFRVVAVWVLAAGHITAQSGGAFTLERPVNTAGGGLASGNGITVNGTIGQPAAGERANNGTFTVFNGFWTPELAPTAAFVSVSGRVLASHDRGLYGAMVLMTDAGGQVQQSRTSSFGYFRFYDVEVGQTYIFTIVSKRYQFAPQVVTITEELNTLHFVPSQ